MKLYAPFVVVFEKENCNVRQRYEAASPTLRFAVFVLFRQSCTPRLNRKAANPALGFVVCRCTKAALPKHIKPSGGKSNSTANPTLRLLCCRFAEAALPNTEKTRGGKANFTTLVLQLREDRATTHCNIVGLQLQPCEPCSVTPWRKRYQTQQTW